MQRSEDKNHSYPIPRVINVGFRSVHMGGNMYHLWKIWMILFIVDEKPLKCDRRKRENHFLKNVLMLRVVEN